MTICESSMDLNNSQPVLLNNETVELANYFSSYTCADIPCVLDLLSLPTTEHISSYTGTSHLLLTSTLVMPFAFIIRECDG